MATKVIVLGQEEANKDLKKIKFVKWLDTSKKWESEPSEPTQWDNIELIAKHYAEDLDLMFAYDGHRDNGILYLGHFNDGVV